MLFVVDIILTIYFLTKKNRRLFVFILTLINSLLFFSSSDPFFGIPLYFYLMIISVALGFDGKAKIKTQRNGKLVFILLLICFFLAIQIVNLISGNNVLPSILINETSTDYMDITTHLLTPTFNFTVFKHLFFYIAYLVFVICNSDLLNDNYSLSICKKALMNSFKFLFVCIIIECLIVNILGGYNDRPIMDFIFNLSSRMSYNWNTFGFSSVCFCFTERSYIDCALVFYLLLALSKKFDRKFIIWFLISGIAILCTSSSTGFAIFLIFTLYFMVRIALKKGNGIIKIAFLVLTIGVTVIIAYNPALFEKVKNYLLYNETWGSAYFRRQANEYGVKAFLYSPFIGVGIGTIYCHSVLIQTVANVGIIGFCLALLFHIFAFKKQEISLDFIVKIVFVIGISTSAFMIQEFTSPYLLCVFIAFIPEKSYVSNQIYEENYNNFNNKKDYNCFPN